MDTKKWFEGVVTSIFNDGIFITFEHGSTICRTIKWTKNLTLGDIIDIRVVPAKEKDCFDLVDMGYDIRRKDNLIVEPFEKSKCSVYCTAEVIDRCKGYFLLKTPIIGLILFFFKDAPREMRVGDMMRVKIMRKKEKKLYPSYWMAMEVLTEFPHVPSSIRKEKKENTGDQNSSSDYLSNNSLQSTLKTSLNTEWTTVILSECDHNGEWYGSCAISDPIHISKKLYRQGQNLEKGALHRVKLSRGSDGITEAIDFDPNSFYPKDVDVIVEDNEIKVWCYSRIVEVHTSSFTVHNNLIGDAILPFEIANKGMREGDMLETLYYRAKNNNIPAHWLVEKIHGNDRDKTEDDHKNNEINSMNDRGNRKYTKKMDDQGVPIRSDKDSRVKDLMTFFLSKPEVRTAFRKNQSDLKRIESILSNH